MKDRVDNPKIITRTLTGLGLTAALLVGLAGPAAAADAAQCRGHWVRALGGPHAVTRKPIKDLADLQKRLPELEAGFRELVAQDASLSPEIAETLIAAIRSGEGVLERNVYRKEEVRWMAYRPARGKLGVIAPPCIDLARDYAAFEIVVGIDDPEPAPVPPPNCGIAATRQCERENPQVAIDLTGSDPGAQVTLARAGEAAHAIAVPGTNFTVADPAPYSADLTLTVTVTAPPPPQRFRHFYRFLLPKTCGNLAYFGPGEAKPLPPPPPVSCTKSVEVGQCAPWCEIDVEPAAVKVHEPVQVTMRGGFHESQAKLGVAGPKHATPLAVTAAPFAVTYEPPVPSCPDQPYEFSCEARNAAGASSGGSASVTASHLPWILRPSLLAFSPTDGKQSRHVMIWDDPAHERFKTETGFGLGLALERRFNQTWGLEVGGLAGKADTKYRLDRAIGTSGSASHNVTFYALTVGPNLHLLGCCTTDLYVGLFAGLGGMADPNYWVGDRRLQATFDSDFVWGAQLGLDVPFKPVRDSGLHFGVRYMGLEQKTDIGKLKVDPLLAEVGLFFRF